MSEDRVWYWLISGLVLLWGRQRDDEPMLQSTETILSLVVYHRPSPSEHSCGPRAVIYLNNPKADIIEWKMEIGFTSRNSASWQLDVVSLPHVSLSYAPAICWCEQLLLSALAFNWLWKGFNLPPQSWWQIIPYNRHSGSYSEVPSTSSRLHKDSSQFLTRCFLQDERREPR